MGAPQTHTLSVCGDCLQAAAGITSEEAGRALPTAPVGAVPDCPEDHDSADECATFSRSYCEGWCESPWLAGERHRVAVLAP